jgi:hypothetical protein
MPRSDPVLFNVLLEKSRCRLDSKFIADVVTRTTSCVRELLAVAGCEGRLRLTVDKSDTDWNLAVHVEQRFLVQMDLFLSRDQAPTVAQASKDVIEAALISLARFRRETAGVSAATLQETLKLLKSADPRVIAAIARQPGRKLTIRQEGTDLELSIQSDSSRTVSTQTETLSGIIVAVGYADLFVIPINRRSVGKLCLHPVRVKIPTGLRAGFDPKLFLEKFVEPRVRVELSVQAEVVVRKRPQVTFLLVAWPLSKQRAVPQQQTGLPEMRSVSRSF